jgi:chorismate mutase
MPLAVSDSIGSSVGCLRGKGTTSAVIDRRHTWCVARLASAELLLILRPMPQETQSPPTQTAAGDPVLAAYRKSIDNIDAAIIHMLAERFRITQAVGEYKAKVTLPPADPDREARQIARLRKLSEEADLDPEFSEKFLRFIIEEVIRHHEKAREA